MSSNIRLETGQYNCLKIYDRIYNIQYLYNLCNVYNDKMKYKYNTMKNWRIALRPY